jgi:hypothetical protein
MFPQPILEPLLRGITFLSGGMITVLFVVGLLTDSGFLLTLEVANGKSIAWLISVLASIYGICRITAIGPFQPYSAEQCMEQIEKELHYQFRDSRNSAHSWEAYANLTRHFRPIFRELAVELFSAVLNPFLFGLIIPMKANSIVDFVMKNSTQVSGRGWICSFSVFGDPYMQRVRPAEQHRKYTRSVAEFNRRHLGGDPLIIFESEIEEPLSSFPEIAVSERNDCQLETLDELGGRDIVGRDGNPFVL